MMHREGPALETLLRHLSECPPEFIETIAGDTGGPQLVAILLDHFRSFGNQSPIASANSWLRELATASQTTLEQVRYLRVLSVSIWLLHAEWFLQRPQLADAAWQFLKCDALQMLSTLVTAQQLVADADRREELVRLTLSALGLRPAGETEQVATDRLMTLDSLERQRVLRSTLAAEKRAREVREAMQRKRALESASRYGE